MRKREAKKLALNRDTIRNIGPLKPEQVVRAGVGIADTPCRGTCESCDDACLGLI